MKKKDEPFATVVVGVSHMRDAHGALQRVRIAVVVAAQDTRRAAAGAHAAGVAEASAHEHRQNELGRKAESRGPH